MNELIKVENGEVKLDSRMIAEHFGKQHSHVMRDIKDEISKLEAAELEHQSIFGLNYFEDVYGRKQPCYIMTEEGALQLAARYDAVARRTLILKIKELKQKSSPVAIDSKMLYQIAQALEEKEKQILMLKPKAEFFDAVADSKTAIEIGEAAKVLNMGIGRNRLFQFL